ncbi:MAG: MinD/ParA family protein [Lachnospira sp.]|nr:MinD/ParA family protein [Lachnospira sp.]
MDQAASLRNIVKQQNQKELTNARVIAVTSGKGGVGKSNTSINIALWYRRRGKRVVILDADFGLANVEVMFGVIPKYNLSDVMFKGMDIKDIVSVGPEGVMFVSGGSGIAKLVNLDREQVRRLVSKMTELEELADVVIIDTGAGISDSVMEFLTATPELVLVTTPEPTSVTDSYSLLKALSMNPSFNNSVTKVMMLANRVSGEAEGKKLFEKLNAVVNRFLNITIEYAGCVPQDDCVSKAVMAQKPVSVLYPNSDAAKAYERLVNTLENGWSEVQKPIGIRGFFRAVFSKKL